MKSATGGWNQRQIKTLQTVGNKNVKTNQNIDIQSKTKNLGARIQFLSNHQKLRKENKLKLKIRSKKVHENKSEENFQISRSQSAREYLHKMRKKSGFWLAMPIFSHLIANTSL